MLTIVAPKKQWSLSEWISNFLQDDHPYYGDADYDENYLPDNDPMPGGDSDGFYDDGIDDGLLESVLIIVLVTALAFLIYWRQQAQQAHRRQEDAARARQGDQLAAQAQVQQPQGGDRGLFPRPGDPEFGQWVAGGVGH